MTEKSKIFCLIITLLSHHWITLTETKANFDVYAKSVKAVVDKEWVKDFKIEIKAKREKPGGVINVQGYLLQKFDENLLLQIQLFYRYGTIYHLYLIDYKRVEMCELVKTHRNFKYANPLADIVVAGLRKCCPQFNHECPYYPGYYNGSNIDVNGTVAPILPPIVPAGK